MKKPMLLSNDDFDLSSLDYSNMFISKKRDGVRSETTNQGIKGRSLKVLKNVNIQNFFKDFCNKIPNNIILEGEIYADGVPCREMAGICNSLNKEVPSNTKLYIFGIYNKELNFECRNDVLKKLLDCIESNKYVLVEQIKVNSEKEVIETYNQFIEDGYEGAVLMDGSKMYKEGRVTINQHIGFKLKPFKEDDLEIIGVNERFLNTNESMTNELGHSYKRNTVDAKEGTGIAATFNCKLKGDVETKVTINGDEESRRQIWNNREDYIGKYVVVKSMDYGAKDKLRHPTMIKIKEECEK